MAQSKDAGFRRLSKAPFKQPVRLSGPAGLDLTPPGPAGLELELLWNRVPGKASAWLRLPGFFW